MDQSGKRMKKSTHIWIKELFHFANVRSKTRDLNCSIIRSRLTNFNMFRKKYLFFIFLCGTQNLTQIRVQMKTYQICFSVHNILPRRCARYIGTKNVLHHSNIRDWIRNLTNFFFTFPIKDLQWQNVSFPLHAALLYSLYRVVWTSIDIDGLTMGPSLVIISCA